MRRNGEFALEVFYFCVVKAGLSTKVRFCAILAVFLLCCYHRETPDSENQRGLRSWNALVSALGVGWELWLKPACRPGGPLVKLGGGAGDGRAIPPVSRALAH